MGEEDIRRIMILGSVPTLGPVMLSDNMEDLLKWTESGSGGDTVFEKCTTLAYNGSACLHMKTRTTNAVEGDVVIASRFSFQRPGKRYRFECLFKHVMDAATKELFFQIYVYDGTNYHNSILKYVVAGPKWQYYTTGGAYVDVPGGSQFLAEEGWHRFLVEVDNHLGEYIRFVCDGLEIPMSGLPYRKGASAQAVKMFVILEAMAGVSPPADAYFDDVLVMEI